MAPSSPLSSSARPQLSSRLSTSSNHSVFSNLSMISVRSHDGEKNKEDYVIVFDTRSRKMFREKPDKVKNSKRKYTKAELSEGKELVADVYVPTGPGHDAVKINIATVNIGLLDRSARRKRKQGKLNHIYVVGQFGKGFDNLEKIVEETKGLNIQE